jgi:hypothetical protein
LISACHQIDAVFFFDESKILIVSPKENQGVYFSDGNAGLSWQCVPDMGEKSWTKREKGFEIPHMEGQTPYVN